MATITVGEYKEIMGSYISDVSNRLSEFGFILSDKSTDGRDRVVSWVYQTEWCFYGVEMDYPVFSTVRDLKTFDLETQYYTGLNIGSKSPCLGSPLYKLSDKSLHYYSASAMPFCSLSSARQLKPI